MGKLLEFGVLVAGVLIRKMVADALILLPALWLFVQTLYRGERLEQRVGWLLLLVIQPAQLLIDHGHFQYNGIALGFVTLAVTAAATNRNLLCAALFCMALLYKQMSLYYALPFFCFLLGKALERPRIMDKLGYIVKLGGIVITVFLIHWIPWLDSPDAAMQVLRRIFPFDRGIYEDKVANFWGASSLIIKWNQWFERPHLVLLSTSMTLIATLCCTVHLIWNPQPLPLLRALAGSALSFFLFSFQVHEKTILFPLLPVLLVGLKEREPHIASHLVVVSCFSMFPLLERDGLSLAYFASIGLFITLSSVVCGPVPYTRRWLLTTSNVGMVIIHLISMSWTPPAKYPDLVTYMFVCFSALHFLGAWVATVVKCHQRAPQKTE